MRRKRAGHLWSKHRYLSAQVAAWLEDGLWRDLAERANAMAARLESGLAGTAELLFPRGGNMIFARWPRALHCQVQAAGAAYFLWPDWQTLDGPDTEMVSARLVCSWNTEASQLDAFLAALGQSAP